MEHGLALLSPAFEIAFLAVLPNRRHVSRDVAERAERLHDRYRLARSRSLPIVRRAPSSTSGLGTGILT
jgi:hypothetical protein